MNSLMLVLKPITNIEKRVVDVCFQAANWAYEGKMGENIHVSIPTIMCVGDISRVTVRKTYAKEKKL